MTEEIALDPTSDRYRICPNCKKAHMVRNRGRDFCSDKCADNFYNNHRRLLKQAEQTSLPQPFDGIVEDHIVPENKEPNIALLDGLEIDPINGTFYHLEDLLGIGYDFTRYDGLYTLHNIPAQYKCRYSQIGPYRLYRITATLMLIAKR